jgi:hypothetical protein
MGMIAHGSNTRPRAARKIVEAVPAGQPGADLRAIARP